MRLTLIALVAVAAFGLAMQPSATQESFFNSRFCTQGGRGSSGMADCSFSTWRQCQESARGLGRYCVENPNWRARDSASRRGHRGD
jgi:hypothetical protein